MALWRKDKVHGIGAKEKSQEKHREKPLHNTGLTFPGAAGSAGMGEAVPNPTDPCPHRWETGESWNPQAPWALLTELPTKRHEVPVGFHIISCSLSCTVGGHLSMYINRGNTWSFLEYLCCPTRYLSIKDFHFFIICVFFGYSTICF